MRNGVLILVGEHNVVGGTGSPGVVGNVVEPVEELEAEAAGGIVVTAVTGTTVAIAGTPNPHQGDCSKAGGKKVSWSDKVKEGIPTTTPNFKHKATFVTNEDGSLTIIPPKEFLVQARQQWNTSCIGHFIGGSFDFKFVRDRAMNL